MSEENVEIARALVAAYNRGDLNAMLEIYHPEVEFVTLLLGNFRGKDALRRIVDENRENMPGYEYEIEELVDAEDIVICLLHVKGTGRVSEISVDNVLAISATFRDGLVTRQQTFRNKGEALESAGLSD